VPQNRERVFLVGIRDDSDNNFRFPIEENLSKRLKDVLQNEVDEKYFLSDKMIDCLQNYESDKFQVNTEMINNTDLARSLRTEMAKMGRQDNYLKIKSATLKGYEEASEGDSINFSVPNSETRRGRVGKQVAQTLDTGCQQGVFNKTKIRRLTPRECFRLMDFPDTFTWPVSDSQAYKQAGNSIVVNVLYKILKNLNL